MSNTIKITRRGAIPLILALLLMISSLAAELRVSAEFRPERIEVGQAAAYTLTFEGISVPPSVRPPAVSGLSWVGTSQQTSLQMHGGRVQQTVALGFNAQVHREGVYTVPEWSAEVDGQRVTFPQAELTVTAATADIPSGGDDRRTIALDDAVFMRVANFPESAYVGQAIEARIDLYIFEELHERDFSQPSQESSDFLVLGQNERASMRRESHNGLNYKVYSWPVSLSPLKAGMLELSYQQVVVVGIPRPAQQRHGAFANDPIFDQMRRMMGTNMEQRQLSLASPPIAVRINELPQAGRPSSFNGAIGRFDVDAVSIDHDQIETGEPAKVTYSIIGHGNLVRIQPPAMAEDGWRVLSPKAEFLSRDPLETRGRKTFSYTLIPETNQLAFTPNFEFSYFNPDEGEYQTIAVDGFPVSVTGEPTRSARDDRRPGQGSPRPDPDRLLPLRTDWSPLVTTIAPIFRSPLFLGAQLIPLLILVLLYGHTRHRWKLRNDPEFARRTRLLGQLAKLEVKARAALADNDPVVALTAWHNAIRCALALHLRDSEPEALTQQDLLPLLDTLDDDERQLLLSLFNAADATRYGHAHAQATNATAIHNLIGKLRSRPSQTLANA